MAQKGTLSPALWHRPVAPALEKLSQEDLEFEANQGSLAKPSLKMYIKKKRTGETLFENAV